MYIITNVLLVARKHVFRASYFLLAATGVFVSLYFILWKNFSFENKKPDCCKTDIKLLCTVIYSSTYFVYEDFILAFIKRRGSKKSDYTFERKIFLSNVTKRR